LLPDLLTWAQRSKYRRAWVVPVVGERGKWLAMHNAEWKNSLQIEAEDRSEQAKAKEEQLVSSQQALYDLLKITDNIFSKTFNIFKGPGPSSHSRMVQVVVDKLVAQNKPGTTYYYEPDFVKIAVATPPAALPELIERLQKTLASGEYQWLSRLVELLDFRHQMLAELKESEE
jgi:hypothetical protein